ncbi:MAG TPA: hypothetical protein VKT78_02450 [Fimbriimonadaceae bacterium]|nr:hypothetical protein [Fimbriimonadaceae bacterium]
MPAVNPDHFGNKIRLGLEWIIGVVGATGAAIKAKPELLSGLHRTVPQAQAIADNLLIAVGIAVIALPFLQKIREWILGKQVKYLSKQVQVVLKLQCNWIACAKKVVERITAVSAKPSGDLWKDVRPIVEEILGHCQIAWTEIVGTGDDRDVEVALLSAADGKVKHTMFTSPGLTINAALLQQILEANSSPVVEKLRAMKGHLHVEPDLSRDGLRKQPRCAWPDPENDDPRGSLLFFAVTKLEQRTKDQLVLCVRCTEPRKFRNADSEWYERELRYFGELIGAVLTHVGSLVTPASRHSRRSRKEEEPDVQ